MQADVIVVGAGLAGLVATCELLEGGRSVILVDQEGEQNLGGQAFWSLGGLFLVDSPEQRRLKIRDSYELALQDWLGTAGFDRPEEDHWPRQWAEAYVAWAAGEKRSWVTARGLRFFPVVGWAERGGGLATGHGNSVPRFHVTWGTGPGVVEPFVKRVQEAVLRGTLTLKCRHRVEELVVSGGAVTGVTGKVLSNDPTPRGQPSSREVVGDFTFQAQAVVVASGGIGGNLDLVRKNWPARMGKAPARMIQGVPDYVDGSMLVSSERAGARLINRDRMWHYVEGLQNWSPIWSNHGVRILPGPSSMWLDARGNRLQPPLLPGFDSLATLEHIVATGFDYSWFVLTQKIIEKEFALSGSEQNPDLTGKSWLKILGRIFPGAAAPVEAFKKHGADFVVRKTLPELVQGMNDLTGEGLIDFEHLRAQVEARDRQLANPYCKDAQITALRGARNYLGDRLIRTAKPHRLLDPKMGPLIAVRLNILTRKTLGGLETDLQSRVFGHNREPIQGLYACGEAAGFGGGGVHGYRALEGSFLGGCLFSGRAAGRAAAAQVL
ncbi:FAD-binding dehydrogenase [bacterium SCN 62-11]|nr:FAD-binding dehydrogenase [Candidatus Eremiobacteraeota bacterium]ODT63129.1 MAG: FAD-binding dehydrogenase [bacterium SCN 62-11]